MEAKKITVGLVTALLLFSQITCAKDAEPVATSILEAPRPVTSPPPQAPNVTTPAPSTTPANVPSTQRPPVTVSLGAPPPPLLAALNATPPSRILTTLNATSITSTSALLIARLNSMPYNLEIAFDYGRTEDFGNRTAYMPMSTVDRQDNYYAVISGLNSNTTYYYRAVCRIVGGNTLVLDQGLTKTFQTLPP